MDNELDATFGTDAQLVFPEVQPIDDGYLLTLRCGEETSQSNDILILGSSGNWIMKINPVGQISFNRDDHPDMLAADFAREVAHALEYTVLSIRGGRND